MTTTPRRGKKMTPADWKYLAWVRAQELKARRDAYRAAKEAFPQFSSRQRRMILAAFRAEG